MIQIFLILFVAAFGQEIETELNCQEGTILQNGFCVVIDVENCVDYPYDYDCGVADKPEHDNFGVIIIAFVVSVIFIITLIMWMKKKK